MPLSSYNSASFALCAVGGDRSKRIRLAGAHVGDSLLHDRPCSKDHHHAHWSLSKSEEVRLALELPLPFYKMVAQAVVVQARAGKRLIPYVDYVRPFTSTIMVQISLQPRGGKAPPVLAEYMSTTSLSICPATAAQLLPQLRQVCSFHGVPNDSILKHVVDLSLSTTDTAAQQLSRECCEWAPPSSPLNSARSMVPLPSRAHVRELLQQPSPEMLYIGRFHRTRSGQVLGESSFANPFKLRDYSNIEECLCLYRNYLRCRPDFPQCLGALSGKRLACHCAVGDRCHADVLIAEFSHFFEATSGPFIAVWATPWNPHAFLEAARLLPHPFQDVALDDNILQLCFDYVTKGADFVMAQRLNFVNKWTARAQQLRAAEIKFRKSLHPVVEKVVHIQQFLVLLEMLQELGFPKYRTLVQLMYTGCPLIAQLEETHIFERRVPPCTKSMADLLAAARSRQEACKACVRSSGDPTIDADVYQTTLDEKDKGWLRGPLVEADFS